MRILRILLLIGCAGLMLFMHDAPLTADTNDVFLQTDWVGGSSVLNASHPANKTGWNRFFSKDTYINVGVAGSVSELVQLVPVVDTSNTDFLLGTSTRLDINGTGTDATLALQAGNDDPASGELAEWTTLPEIPALTEWSAFARAGNYVYAIWRLTTFARFNMTTEEWEFLADIPGPASQGAALAYVQNSDFIYATRGGGTMGFYKYSISAGTWTRLADVPYGVGYGGSLASNNVDKIYCLVGGGSNRFYMYTIATNTWSTLPVATRTVTRGGSLVYPGTGTDLFAVFDTGATTFSRYSMAGNAWVPLTAAPVPLGNLCYPGTGNFLYGWYDETWSSYFARYNFVTSAWENLSAASQFPMFQYRGFFYDPATDGSLRWLSRGNFSRSMVFDPVAKVWNTGGLNKTGVKWNSVSSWGRMVYDGVDYIYQTTGGTSTGFARYSITGNEWTAMRASPFGNYYGHDMVRLNGSIYAIQGYSNTGFARYDPGTNLWTSLAVTPASINYGGTIATDGTYIYCLQGTSTATFWRYNTVTNVWEGVAQAATTNAPATINGGSLIYPYAPGAGDFLFTPRGLNTKTFYKYEISTKTWTQAADAPFIFSSNDKSTLTYPGSGDHIYAFFGSAAPNCFARYNFVTDAWEVLSSTPIFQNTSFAAVAVGDKIYATNASDMLTYTISTNTWDSPRNYDLPSFTYGSIINPETDTDSVYLFYGNQGSFFWKYSIAQKKWIGLLKAPFLFNAGAKAAYPGSGDFVYVTEGGYKKSFWKYDLLNKTWSSLADAPREIASGCKLTGKGDVLYMTPGRDPGNPSSQASSLFYKYTISTNTWDTLVSLPQPIYASVELGNSMIHVPDQGRVYFRPGNGSGSFYSYNTGANAWTTLASLPIGGYDGQALHYPGFGDYIYNLNEVTSGTFYRYSISTNTWMEMSRSSRGAGYYSNDADMFYPGSGDHLYYFDGVVRYFARYSLGSNAWDQPATFPSSTLMQYYASFERGEDGYSLYAAGNNLFYKYSLLTRTWASLGIPFTDVGWYWDEWAPQLLYPGSGDYLYATRGRNRTDFARYSVSQNKWFALTTPPTNFGSGHKLAGTVSKIYALRGDSQKSFWVYDIAGNQWSSLADVPVTVHYGSSLCYPGSGDFLYATSGNSTSDFYKYSIQNNTWTQLTSAPVILYASDVNGASLMYPGRGDHLYLLPGSTYGYSYDFAGFYRYSISQNTWQEAASAPAGIYGTFSKIVYPGKGDYLYATRGGYGSAWDILQYRVFRQGQYTSPIKNIGLNQTYDTVTWTDNAKGLLEFKVRTSNDPLLTDAPSWENVPLRTKGQNISSSYPSVKPNDQYLQYQMNFIAENQDDLPSLSDLTINYDKYPRQQELISSAFNAAEARNRLMKLSWNNTLPAGTSARFLLRTAPDSGGAPGSWTAWLGPGGTQTIDNTFAEDAQYVHEPVITVTDGVARLTKVLEDYPYTQRITLDNDTGANTYTDVVATIDIDAQNVHFWEHVSSDGADIRFLDGDGDLLTYNSASYGASFDASARTARIYVKVPLIPAGERATIYMKYGNPAAVSASDSTLIPFISFGASGVINATDFNYSSDLVLEDQDKVVRMTGPVAGWGSKYLSYKTTYLRSEAKTFFFRFKHNGNATSMIGWRVNSTDYGYWQMPHSIYFNSGRGYIYESGSNVATVEVFSLNTWYDVKIVLKPAGGATYYWRPTGQTPWSLLYNSTSRTETNLRPSVDHNPVTPYAYTKDWVVQDENYAYPTTSGPSTVVSSYFSAVEDNTASPALSGWPYRNAVEIDNTGGGELTNYQIEVPVTSGFEGFWENCSSNGEDVRFVDHDNTTILDHYTKTFDHSAKTATFWVKVPRIPAGEIRTLYLYYGRSDAADASSMNNTLIKDFDERGTENISGLSVSGNSARAVVSSSDILSMTNALTLEAQVKLGIDYWPPGWGYRKKVTLDNASGGEKKDLLVQFAVPMQAGMKADYADLRFWETDHSQKLRYKIKSSDAASATVNVVIPYIAANSTKEIYVYYGNASAVTESENTLGDPVFYDDFDTDLSKWPAASGAALSNIDGRTTVTVNGGYIQTTALLPFQNGHTYTFEYAVRGTAGQAFVGLSAVAARTSSSLGTSGYLLGIDNAIWSNSYFYNELGNGINYLEPQRSAYSPTTWYVNKFVWTPGSSVTFIIKNGLDTQTQTSYVPQYNDAIYPTVRSASGNIYVDYIKIYEGTFYDLAVMTPVFGAVETDPGVVPGLPGFAYRKTMTIDNTGNLAVSNATYSVDVAYVAGKMKSDYGDVRFVDTDGQTIPCNIFDADATSANFLLKVPVVPANSTKIIYMYYGNPDAEAFLDTSIQKTLSFSYPNFTGWIDNAGSPPRLWESGVYKMMEGYGNGGSGAYAQYTVPSLAAGTYNVSLDIYLLDSWDGEYMQLFANGVKVWEKYRDALRSEGIFLGQIVGTSTSYATEYKWSGSMSVTHTGGDLTLRFTSTLNEGATSESWGLDNIVIHGATSITPAWGSEEAAASGIDKTIVMKDGAYGLKFTDSGLTAVLNGTSLSTASYDSGKFMHAAMTYDGSQLKVFVNGDEKASSVFTADVNTNANPLVIGEDMNGVIDEVRLWNTARLAGDINADRLKYLDGTQTGLAAYLRFNEAAGEAAVDATIYGNDAVLENGAGWALSPFSYSNNKARAIYHMDTGTGSTALDASGNNNALTLSNTSWLSTDLTGFPSGKALNFNGTTSYGSVADNSTLDITGKISLEAWIRPLTSLGDHVILAKGNDANLRWNYQLLQVGDSIAFVFANGVIKQHLVTPACILADNTYYIVATFDEEAHAVKIYVNGALRYSNTDESSRMLVNTDPLYVGREASGANPFSGTIDEVRIYNRVLSQGEITAHYEHRSPVVVEPLLYNIYEPLTSVDVGAYAINNPVIQPIRGVYFTDKNLIQFQEISNKPYGTDVRYQVSPNAYTWYWWDGSTWTIVSGGYSQTNTAVEVNAHLAAMMDLFPDGVFYYRAYLHAEPFAFRTPSLDNVGITLTTDQTYYILNDGSVPVNPIHSDADNDQWYQYKAILYSDGMDTGILDDVSVEYIKSSLEVTAPDGGEVFAVGSTVPITWSAQAIAVEGGSGLVKLQYSLDEGNIYVTIAEHVANTGSYSWTIPDIPSQQALIKITSEDLPVVSDVSDAVFRILSVAVTSPNGGEAWEAGKAHNITWDISGAVPNNVVKIEYSSNGGSTWSVISAVAPNSGTFSWTTPSVFSDDMRIRISSSSNAQIMDTSDAAFSIVRVPAFTISSPAEGQEFSVGATAAISWRTNSLLFADQVLLEYSTDDFEDDVHQIATVSVGTPQGTDNNDNILGEYAWTVPDIIGSGIKVRVTEAEIPPGRDTQQEISIVSPAFAIVQPQISIAAPVAEDVLVVGDTNNIIWTTQGSVSDDLKLEYSIDGTDFILISDHEANAGTYAWTVPAGAVGDAVYIRITDNERAQVEVLSDAFRVLAHATVEIIQPNGGESLTMGTDYEVRWRTYGNKLKSGGADYNKISIYYSIDNGENWTLVVFDRANTGSYVWRIPDLPTTEALIRVEDQNDAMATAVSAQVFTIVLPVITLTKPVGGESWYSTGSYELTWTSVGSISNNLKLEYSTNSGTTWSNIKTGQPNTGTYTWGPVADADTTQARVRITDLAHPTVIAVSPADFTIMPPTISVTSPNGGEAYAVGTTQTIRWTSMGEQYGAIRDNLTIQFSMNNGSSWTTVAAGEVNDGAYEWVVPDNLSGNCLIKIFDATRPATADTSDAVFTVALPSITLTAPNGGEEWQIGANKEIRWTSLGAVSNNLKIEYSKDNFQTATTVAINVSNVELYVWSVPDDLSAVVKIRITDMDRTAITDQSDTPFSIVNPVLSLTYPNGGELLSVGDIENITWSGVGAIGNSLKIEYSKDSFVSDLHEIAASAPNTGSFAWTLPEDQSVTVKVRIIDNTRPVVWDKSDQNFTILPTPVITITAPVAEDLWRVGTIHDITWTDNGGRISNNLTLQYSTDGGGTWKLITTGVPNTGTYAWTVPDDVSATAKVRIFDANRVLTTDNSEIFNLALPLLTLVAPNGGEIWSVGDRGPVSWTSEGTISSNLILEYSPDNGANWYLVRGGIPNSGSFSWTVPDYVTAQCLLRIKDGDRPAVYDVSDATFTINPMPTITITSPSGGEDYVLGNTVTIRWTWTGLSIGNMTLDYSNDNFATRRIIATNLANTGSYDWTIPSDAFTGTTMKIRLTDGTRTQIVGQSAGFFRIRGGFVLLGPNGGENWVAQSPQTISWQTRGTIPNVKIEYTLDGTNWVFIGAPANAGTYTWTLPNARSTHAKVRVSDPDDPTTTDESDAEFSMVYSTVIFKVLDYDSLQHLQDFSVSEPVSGWADSGQNSPITRTEQYPYGTYTTFFTKQDFIDTSVTWNPPKSGLSAYNITVYMENSSNAQVSWEAILTYSFSPGNDTLMAIASLQRKGKLIGTTELERADLGAATLKIFEPDGATVRNELTATTPANTGMYNFTLAETDFEGGLVYPATLSIEYRGRPYVSVANIDVGSEILQYQFFTETATNLANSVANIERTVNSTANDIKTEIKGAIEVTHSDLKEETAKIRASTETDLPAQLSETREFIEIDQKSAILNQESSIRVGEKMIIRYRTYPGLNPVIDVYNQNNIQQVINAPMVEVGTTGIYEYEVTFFSAWGKGQYTIICSEPTKGSMDALTLTVQTSDVDQVYNQISSVVGSTANLPNINNMMINLGTQFAAIEGVLSRSTEDIVSGVRGAMGSASTMGTLFTQLKAVAKQVRQMGGDKGINLESLYNVAEDRQQDMVYLKNKTQELKATMELNKKLIENMSNKPVVQTWYEYKQ